MSTDSPIPYPRLRLLRETAVQDFTLPGSSIAGSSRLSDTQSQTDDSTPRAPPRTDLESGAAKLRALLAKMPASPARNASPMRPTTHPSEEDLELSDIEEVSASLLAQPSMAHESLKDLFSKVMSDSTPRKPAMKRSNSVDGSDIEASPFRSRARINAKLKGRSVSDEEIESMLTSVDDSVEDMSFSSSNSRALTFSMLRNKLNESQSRSQGGLGSNNSYLQASANSGHMSLSQMSTSMNMSKFPPAASSTPQKSRSPKMAVMTPSASHISLGRDHHSKSDLLGNDFSMHRVLASSGLDSSEAEEQSSHVGRVPTLPHRPPSRLSRRRTPHEDSTQDDETSDDNGQHVRMDSLPVAESSSRSPSPMTDEHLNQSSNLTPGPPKPRSGISSLLHQEKGHQNSVDTSQTPKSRHVDTNNQFSQPLRSEGYDQDDDDRSTTKLSSSGSSASGRRIKDFLKLKNTAEAERNTSPQSSPKLAHLETGIDRNRSITRSRLSPQNFDSGKLLPRSASIDEEYEPTLSDTSAKSPRLRLRPMLLGANKEATIPQDSRTDEYMLSRRSPRLSHVNISSRSRSSPTSSYAGFSPRTSPVLTPNPDLSAKNDEARLEKAISSSPSHSPPTRRPRNSSSPLLDDTDIPPHSNNTTPKFGSRTPVGRNQTRLETPPTVKPAAVTRPRTPTAFSTESKQGYKSTTPSPESHKPRLSFSSTSHSASQLDEEVSMDEDSGFDNDAVQEERYRREDSYSVQQGSMSMSITEDLGRPPYFDSSEQNGRSEDEEEREEEGEGEEGDFYGSVSSRTSLRVTPHNQTPHHRSRSDVHEQPLEQPSSPSHSMRSNSSHRRGRTRTNSLLQELNALDATEFSVVEEEHASSVQDFASVEQQEQYSGENEEFQSLELPGSESTAESIVQFQFPNTPKPEASIVNPKTPALPGAYLATPAPKRHQSSDRAPSFLSHDGPNNDAQKQASVTPSALRKSASLSFMKTPAPPGAYLNTPAPSRARSMPSETPRPSSSAHTSAPWSAMKTPAPPGAWAGTPAPLLTASRSNGKLKVRFQQDEEGDSGEFLRSSSPLGKAVSRPSTTNGKATSSFGDDAVTTSTPPLATAGEQKLSGVRILDSFGRDSFSVADERASPVKFVDAMGREVYEEVKEEDDVDEGYSEETTQDEEDEEDEWLPPMDKEEAATRMRNGFAHLKREFQDMDDNIRKYSASNDRKQLLAFKKASEEARLNRERLQQQINAVQVAQSKGSLIAGRLSGRWAVSPYLLWFLAFAQLALIIFFYRVSLSQTKMIFLTQYYDPFYADLHLNIFRSGSILRQGTGLSQNISSIYAVASAGYWNAAFLQLRGYLALLLDSCFNLLLRYFDSKQEGEWLAAWPPT